MPFLCIIYIKTAMPQKRTIYGAEKRGTGEKQE